MAAPRGGHCHVTSHGRNRPAVPRRHGSDHRRGHVSDHPHGSRRRSCSGPTLERADDQTGPRTRASMRPWDVRDWPDPRTRSSVRGMRLTVLQGDSTATVESSADLALTPDALLEATGWELKPQGLCRDDVCVPGTFDPLTLTAVATALQRPLAAEVLDDQAVAVLGEGPGSTVRAGEVAEPLTLPDVDGQPLQVTGSGRKTAVVAWSTWCGCRYELPAWKQLAEELRAEGLDVVTVALDDDPEAVRSWAERGGLPTAVDTEHRLSDLFGVVNVPSTVWLDEDGRVVKPPTIAPGDDQFIDWTKVSSEQHHDALRAWVRDGSLPDVRSGGWPPGCTATATRRRPSGTSKPLSRRPHWTSRSCGRRCRCAARTRSARSSSPSGTSGMRPAGPGTRPHEQPRDGQRLPEGGRCP